MKDLFSKQSVDYAAYRPKYPKELFDFILSHIPNKNAAWDCGTGNGQVAVELSNHFKMVYATDLSKEQIANAHKRENIIYRVLNAEETRFENLQFDLITVAQALHWFDFSKFYSKVREYLKSDGVFSAIGYDLIKIDPDCDRIIKILYEEILKNYWDPERNYIDERYRSIPFPFKEIPAPEFSYKIEWTFDHLTGYLNTWSAVQHYIRQNKYNPLETIQDELLNAWGNCQYKEVTFPVFIRIGSNN